MKHNNPNLIKRKKSIMEIVSSIIIWLSPLAVFGVIFILNYNDVVSTTTKTKIAGWFCFAFVILLIIYWKCLKKKLKERVLADKINEEKSAPLIVLLDMIFSLLPFVIIVLLYYVVRNLNLPLIQITEIIAGCEFVGWMIKLIDSLKEAKYYNDED